MENKNLPAYPINYIKTDDGNVFNSVDDNMGGLTKRELISAMATTPKELIESEFNKWRGDGNDLVQSADYKNYETMIKNVARIDAQYKIALADELLNQLYKP